MSTDFETDTNYGFSLNVAPDFEYEFDEPVSVLIRSKLLMPWLCACLPEMFQTPDMLIRRREAVRS